MRKSSGKIKDFGKKIGGAKKDLWAGRNLEVEDLFMMDEIDRNGLSTLFWTISMRTF